ncbi:MAG: DUF480 domain-containing protein [Planctomycetes bacterium]|nr:DUF480 domain-containing protein [Planctomycetota bacterium]
MDENPSAMPLGAPALNATERRIVGVLIEKGLSTPEYYPMTVNALVAGCNQKNNRDPLTVLDVDAVETSLKSLEQKGLVLSVIADSGRVVRWRQELVRKLELSVTDLAVLGELLLRGEQSEGDLRGRASRMRPIETLEALREMLKRLAARRPPLVIRLSPEGSARGVQWTHGMFPADQLAKAVAEPAPAPARDELLLRLERLEARVARLESDRTG